MAKATLVSRLIAEAEASAYLQAKAKAMQQQEPKQRQAQSNGKSKATARAKQRQDQSNGKSNATATPGRYTWQMRPFLAMFAAFLAVAGSACQAQAAGAGSGHDSYRVYSASLPFGYHTSGLDVAIRSRTVAVPDLKDASNSVQREFESMQSDPELKAAIQQMLSAKPAVALLPDFHLAAPVKVELLDSDVLDGQLHLNDTPLGRKAGWRTFNETHQSADGLTEVSAVGFNPAHTVAVYYAIHRSGTGCNDEGFEVLRKSKGQWHRFPDKGFSFAACN